MNDYDHLLIQYNLLPSFMHILTIFYIHPLFHAVSNKNVFLLLSQNLLEDFLYFITWQI